VYFKKFLKKDFISVIDITENLAKEFRKYLLDHLNGQTPLDYFSRFKKVIEAAKSDGYFRNSPVEKVMCKSHPSTLKETLEPPEFIRLVELHWLNYEVKKAAVTSLYSAFRWCDEPLLIDFIHSFIDLIRLFQELLLYPFLFGYPAFQLLYFPVELELFQHLVVIITDGAELPF